MTTRAEQLGITDGLVWVVGRSAEELSLLEPLPDGVETVNERPRPSTQSDSDTSDWPADSWRVGDWPDEPEWSDASTRTAAALIVIDDDDTIGDDFDEALPQMGSIPLVWVAIAHSEPGISVESVTAAASEYGWRPGQTVPLGRNWTALRLLPA